MPFVDELQNTENSNRQQDDEKIQRLRSLVLGKDYEKALKTFITESDTERVSEVISEALRERAQKDQSLSKVLSPIIDSAIDESIKQNPKRITNIIFPVMGPAIRKAVSAALSDMVQTLNDILSNGLSIKSWAWRFQAWRAGKSYGEYVLLKTLTYRVDQVLLIHKETGLLLCDVCSNADQREDPELVSAMLTAINDFVADSFHKPEKLTIDSIRFGEYTLTIIAGPLAIIAAAIKGSPGPEINQQLSHALEKIHTDHLQALIDFNGDKNDLLAAEPILNECLLKKALEQKKSKPWLAYGLLTALACLLITQFYFTYQKTSQRNHILTRLQQQPGYLVVDESASGNTLNIVMLRSPLTPKPATVLQDIKSNEWQLVINDQIAPLQTSQYLLPYLKNLFELPPETTVTTSTDNKLIITGAMTKSQQQSLLASDLIATGFNGIDFSNAQILPGPTQQQLLLNQWQQLVAEIQSLRIYFEINSNQLSPGEETKIVKAVNQIKKLDELAKNLDLSEVQVLITGFADFSGSAQVNNQLSKLRAETISNMLKANELDSNLFIVWGAGHIDTPNLSAQEQRIVSFQVLHPPLKETATKDSS